ncbi:hypothetical protein LOD99_587 [Oopsacas minuta]|uniref:Uncharacterized protein n=1 Tax=Oopsacas minuta TaxID=111878 RepID=A0AAV7KAA7_9METZ|nr:hypothetical protein LOD99_587 [Oopsacas minuta]
MDCADISKKVENEIYTLSKIFHTFEHKYLLEIFSEVLNDNGNIVFGVACCNHCLKFIIYKMKMDSGKIIDSGTKNLNDHTRHCSQMNHHPHRLESRLFLIEVLRIL